MDAANAFGANGFGANGQDDVEKKPAKKKKATVSQKNGTIISSSIGSGKDGEAAKQLKPKSFGKVATGGVAFDVPASGHRGTRLGGDEGKKKTKSGQSKKK